MARATRSQPQLSLRATRAANGRSQPVDNGYDDDQDDEVDAGDYEDGMDVDETETNTPGKNSTARLATSLGSLSLQKAGGWLSKETRSPRKVRASPNLHRRYHLISLHTESCRRGRGRRGLKDVHPALALRPRAHRPRERARPPSSRRQPPIGTCTRARPRPPCSGTS